MLVTGLHFSCPWHRLHVFPRFASITCFLCLAPVVCFPALCIGYLFSRAWPQLCAFPRLEPVACFPVLGTGWVFSRAWPSCVLSQAWHQLLLSRPWQQLHLFPRLTQIAHFFRAYHHRLPTLGTGHTFSNAWHQSHVFPSGRSYFSRARHKSDVSHACCCCLE